MSLLSVVGAIVILSASGVGRIAVAVNQPRTSRRVPAVPSASLFFDDHYNLLDSRRNVFVGVAISGGGSRAAVFASEVLSALSELGFLEHVTAISSVSVGSLPAAYFALSKHDPMRWPMSAIRDAMALDFHQDLITDVFKPATFMRMLGTAYNRTDLLADVLDRRIFQGATFSTFNESHHDGARVPHLFLMRAWRDRTMRSCLLTSLSPESDRNSAAIVSPARWLRPPHFLGC